ncbi:DUF6565 domain-containing protein [Flavobacterium caeni]|uniref:DUF6565 domain-containing protein n=1 Tax=Flavobacterium caeni TaxID=490189 RepID=A0A1G5AL49_9FLAO|nr:DUF6565 domain-containing protein [Flavobacterium caeni]SCX78623.1 hypothetical protein SAMN02927903_00049 [Flavobacterium caeni]
MKSKFLLLGAAACIMGMTSCKNEAEENAKRTVDTYAAYVDSVSNVAVADAKANWDAINERSEQQLVEAKAALAALKDKTAAEEKVMAAEAKYTEWKSEVEAAVAADSDPKAALRNALFGEGKVGADMKFDWVNKDNIHATYQNFIHTVENNKDKYTREDWDEIKVLYEALDTRKNVVEKEGLSSEDNMKIAGLKVKFAPMLKVNRVGEKTQENADAKK